MLESGTGKKRGRDKTFVVKKAQNWNIAGNWQEARRDAFRRKAIPATKVAGYRATGGVEKN